ncbi:MAG: hypothetical protein L0Y72_19380 [Gemmataceae bacterium]|nr:hypothetical protein [Gemmataceae bacterium]MCI0741198.1 hypothetical protein [Gemmataceae bacterium]
MRLTLRTLLAYIDDTLEPAQAKVIGQKVAESESAQELIEKIRQVTRRRRLTTPPAGSIDPNTIADYLDNAVTSEQSAEVEQICLSSDVHLAEVAACHQILTLILGEPASVAGESYQRMYGLVKGPAAIPFRRPPASAVSETDSHSSGRDEDETLRMGVPALQSKDGWRNPLLLVGVALAACVLLGVAIWQALPTTEKEPAGNFAGADPNKVQKGDEKKGSEDVKKGAVEKKDTEIKDNKEKDNSTKGNGKDTGKKTAGGPEISIGPPNKRQAPIGKFETEDKSPTVLLQTGPDGKSDWRRINTKQPDVYSARPLVSLPACRSTMQIFSGIKLTLWGSAPEFVSFPPLHESAAELFAHDQLDLDMILHRGRVVLTSTRTTKPVTVRLRFENPQQPKDQEFFDITLKEKGASILVERWSKFAQSEPFFLDPKHTDRIGPIAQVVAIVMHGNVVIKSGDLSFTMSAPPGPALLLWDSRTRVSGPSAIKSVPDILTANPPFPQGMDPKLRKDMLRARDYLASRLDSKEVANIHVALEEMLYGSDPMARYHAVRCLAALDDLSTVLEALDQPKLADVRLAAGGVLRNWIGRTRDNDYVLFELLKEKYKHKEAEIIMELLHGLSEEEIKRPERYELLIDYLVNPNLVIRELGRWHLYALVPAGRNIPYSATDSAVRSAAEREWRRLIPPGQLPPATMPPKTKPK